MTTSTGPTPDSAPSRPAWAERDDRCRRYYDEEWGRPIRDERGLFELLTLLTFQLGLTWSTVLAYRESLRLAFRGFDPVAVAAFGTAERTALLADPAMIRNARKIDATITNAAATVALRDRGGLAALVWSLAPADRCEVPRYSDPAELPRSTPASVALSSELRDLGFTGVGPISALALLTAAGVLEHRLTPAEPGMGAVRSPGLPES